MNNFYKYDVPRYRHMNEVVIWIRTKGDANFRRDGILASLTTEK